MNDFLRIPLGQWVENGIDYITETFGAFFDVIKFIIASISDGMNFLFTSPPFWVILIIFAVIAFVARGWMFSVGSILGFLLILTLDQWENAMDTMALVLVAAFLAIIISVPLGILAAKYRTVSTIVKPILDFLQTMPAFVYLIPALILFRIGDVPGIVATVLFALAPGVRLTELGIRGVDSEVVEAGQAFGASPGRILRQIQLPLALPSIMAGINQVIMLSLSMVVIASMVGAGGLGQPVIQSLSRADVALGFEAGLSVVILAIFLDRLTASFGSGKGYFQFIIESFKVRSRSEESEVVDTTADSSAATTEPAEHTPPVR
ncbi:proline/glycine betaine ABC transporter permease [Salinibacterium sp. NSLL150]|uniref:ABC transporter permease n=1 Tax=unclassified Salinibacterium TaxID=2632331 RepID=UPI0018CD0405|nr:MULTISPECIES: proline/glycine betaine ABC transporter permease [unclassified Salinibacterium]MBH0023787.1 proline/glycine betaine ABC transporter permease [Salinibacterium sp. SWN248]MBH0098757.1 proline/glycine betaine ABC transporter permease [Salinibacterium sp. NSLL35]MBH0101512.1 proline/glycine betaine ABC transporter permease [Salinibacterium sp. NSLL150]MBH0104271.1 proline/glycine betaine ABC transporter permease [Salinibacterium sp. NSLL16]MBH0107032.1 proline/glycine betaine ABC 